MGIPFQTPWWDANWLRYVPWVGVCVAMILLVFPALVELWKIAAMAPRKVPPTPKVNPSRPITAADFQKVRDLDSALENALSDANAQRTVAAAPGPAPASTPAAPPRAMKGGPLESIQPTAQDQKDYHGEFYPVEKPHKQGGFTIVELLVVIGVIAVLLALLLPALSGARRDANQIVCESNLRSIGQALAAYEAINEGFIPASYSYHGQTITNGKQTYTVMRYVHWSYFIYGKGLAPPGSLQCPELDGGGLPPTNTTDDNLLPGQVDDTPGVVDEQVPRVAYTLNEALSPRNKFALGFQGAVRIYRFVHVASLPHPSTTILATEWGGGGPAPPRDSSGLSAGQFEVDSHRPVHGFVGLDGTLDMYQLNPGVGYRRVTSADLDPDPASMSDSGTRLDWVGRNHGNFQGYPDRRRTNFLYVDGHVECKTIYETLSPFQWGDKFYTLEPNDDLQQ
jgi:prepilin-type N-terminal cleavage/methylation domain-containing protein/prepilin-type processing-associated H-X9-DG protein